MRNAITGLILMACAMGSFAEESPIGYVKSAVGPAHVITQATQVEAEPGTAVFAGSTLKTGAGGSLGITFEDETVISLGSDTELTIDEYVYAPTDDNLKLASNLLRGTMNYISGLIAKLKPDAVTVKTPTGTIGVRGTNFVAKVD